MSEAREAQGVRAALRAAKRPDLILLEEHLPGGDVIGLIRGARKNDPTLAVILIASNPSESLLMNAFQAGAADVLSSSDVGVVLAAAERAVGQKRAWETWLKKETGRITGPLSRRLSELEAILGQVDDGVLVVDGEYRVLMVNQALRQNFELGTGDLTGKPLATVLNLPGLLDALSEKSPGVARHEIQSPKGHVFHVRVSDAAGVGKVASLHDISYLKELDKMKGDFVNTVSHDLRSPLTAILGYVELIERAGKVNPQQAEFIHRVKSSVHATTNLIDDLLRLGRVEVGALDENTPVDVKLLVVNTMANLQPTVQEKNQTLRLRRGGSLRNVLGSRSQLSQLVDNLIGNAVKYTPAEGKIFVTLEEEQNQLILRVADNGPGIPLEEQGRIFEKFYRATNVENSVPGTGLGLAIVKTIVDNHGGRIWVDSKPGLGAVFTVVLPVYEGG